MVFELNFYSVPALISLILFVFIGVFVYYKNPGKKDSEIFLLFSTGLCFFSIGELMLRYSSTIDEALFWGRIGYLGITLISPALFHFSLVFPEEQKLYIEKKFIVYLSYIISLTLFLIFNNIISYSAIEVSPWGYRLPIHGPIIFIAIWGLILSILAILNLIYKHYHLQSVLQKKQLKILVWGITIMVLFGLVTNIIVPLLGIILFPMATFLFVILALFISAAILKYNLLTFKSLVQPKLENENHSKIKFYFEKGQGYLINETNISKSQNFFSDQISHGIQGLCITKLSPKKVKGRFGLKKTPIIWITFKDVENAISPEKINDLKLQILDFTSKAEKSCILVDCFREIVMVNGFEKAIDFLMQIKKICEENNSNLLVSLNPEMFEEHQLAILEKKFLEVK